MSQLSCPKCHGAMRQYERSGVTVDQCVDCRGIFLDRGELERLADAETSFHDSRRPERRDSGYDSGFDIGSQRRYDDDDDDHHRRYGSGHGRPHQKRKRSFLEDLFD
jgi:uncharacterized protein